MPALNHLLRKYVEHVVNACLEEVRNGDKTCTLCFETGELFSSNEYLIQLTKKAIKEYQELEGCQFEVFSTKFKIQLPASLEAIKVHKEALELFNLEEYKARKEEERKVRESARVTLEEEAKLERESRKTLKQLEIQAATDKIAADKESAREAKAAAKELAKAELALRAMQEPPVAQPASTKKTFFTLKNQELNRDIAEALATMMDYNVIQEARLFITRESLINLCPKFKDIALRYTDESVKEMPNFPILLVTKIIV